MPEGKLLDLAAFRLIQGSKIPEPELEVAPSPDANAEVLEVLVNAAEHAAGNWQRVFVIFEDAEGGIDFMYSTTTDAEKLLLIERAKVWLMSFGEE